MAVAKPARLKIWAPKSLLGPSYALDIGLQILQFFSMRQMKPLNVPVPLRTAMQIRNNGMTSTRCWKMPSSQSQPKATDASGHFACWHLATRARMSLWPWARWRRRDAKNWADVAVTWCYMLLAVHTSKIRRERGKIRRWLFIFWVWMVVTFMVLLAWQQISCGIAWGNHL